MTSTTGNPSSPSTSSTAPEACSQEEEGSQDVVPYKWWWHPHKSFTDIVVGYMLSWLVPFQTISATEPRPSPESVTTSQTCRASFNQWGVPVFRQEVQAWAKQQASPIAQVLWEVPRRSNLLHEWNVVTEKEEPSAFGPGQQSMPTGALVANLYFPTSILGSEARTKWILPDAADNEYGAKPLPTECALPILQQLPPDVPLVVFMHGGGLNVGTAQDPTILELVRIVSSGHNDRPAVVVSVEYSLVPEHPFPAAVVECLTVVLYLLDQLPPDRRIHVAGLSAGAHLAISTTLELLRHPHDVDRRRIASLSAMSPMLDPLADSESYYRNTGSSFVTPEWLRWCWQAYLGLPRGLDEPAAQVTSANAKFGELCQRHSNRTAYQHSRWPGSTLERLVRPVVDVPMWDDTGAALPVLVSTNLADPLHDDGVAFVKKLCQVDPDQRRYSVTHLPHRGSHWLGTHLDSRAYGELAEAWGRQLFSSPIEGQ